MHKYANYFLLAVSRASRLTLTLALLLGVVLQIPASVAQAYATFVVTTELDTIDIDPGNGSCNDAFDECSLRAAVMEANALPGVDTIHLPAGTYTLTLENDTPTAIENEARTGDLDVLEDLSVIGISDNPADTIIQAGLTPGSGIDRVFSFNPTFGSVVNAELRGLTIRHGYTTGTSESFGGGVDWNANGSGTLTISNCVITQNASSFDGGGIAVSDPDESHTNMGKLILVNSVISNNESFSQSAGGIYIGPYLQVSILESTISGNIAARNGGGIYQAGSLAAVGLSIQRSAIINNAATSTGGLGGGIYSHNNMEIDNSTISGNTAADQGGGIYVHAPVLMPVKLTNVTVTNNTAFTGGGLRINASGSNLVGVFNSLVTGNFAINLVNPDVSGNLGNGSSNNLITRADVALGPLADNGGPTLTHALLPGSPALDAGDTSLAVGDFDQRGFARAADAADSGSEPDVDIGAFEAYPSINPIDDQQGVAGVTLDVPFRLGSLLSGGSYDFAIVSDNPTLLPNNPANMSVSGTGADRELHLTPALGQKGTAQVTVTVSDGAQQVSESFLLSVVLPPDLTLNKTHSGEFIRGQSGGVFTLTVSNIGDLPTSGTVTVVDTLPAGLTAASMTGSGWNCTLATLTCTRANALAAGASYPPITLAVSVTANAPDSLTNNAEVSGGAELDDTNNAASDTVLLNTRLYLPIIRRP